MNIELIIILWSVGCFVGGGVVGFLCGRYKKKPKEESEEEVQKEEEKNYIETEEYKK